MAEKPQPGIKGTQTLDPENRLPAEKYQYVSVRFDTANLDVAIVHRLNPVVAEEVMYSTVRVSNGSVIYQDTSPTRRVWQRSHIFLRASLPCVATILLTLPSEEEELVQNVDQSVAVVAPTTVTVAATAARRAFGITIDGGTAVITTGIKGMVRLPVNGNIQKYTIMSTDALVTSGSIQVDVWKDSFGNFSPVNADSITASAPVILSSATKYEDSTLAGWNRVFLAGDVFAFNVDSATSVKRVTIVMEYLET